MKIPVKYNDSYYYWVDTVVMHDERDYTCAVLVSDNGNAFPICIDRIKVVDDSYNYKKNVQKRIDELKLKDFELAERTRLEAALSKTIGERYNDKIPHGDGVI